MSDQSLRLQTRSQHIKHYIFEAAHRYASSQAPVRELQELLRGTISHYEGFSRNMTCNMSRTH
eukprot:3888310-Pleurochrysis_carterae.AAC.1